LSLKSLLDRCRLWGRNGVYRDREHQVEYFKGRKKDVIVNLNWDHVPHNEFEKLILDLSFLYFDGVISSGEFK
jgi:hypothetical protein